MHDMGKSWKWMAAGLAVTILLSACASGNNEENKPESNSQTAVTLDANKPGWTTNTKPITFDWYINFSWFNAKWGEDKTSQYVTRKTGVDINFIVPAGNEKEKMNTMIASGHLPDFITLGSSDEAIATMIEGDMLLPLDELAEQYDPYFLKIADPAKLGWYTQEDGHVYGYPNASSSAQDYEKYGTEFTSNQTFLVRKDIYEAIGKPEMRTPEGFLGALRAAKEKFPEVNGQPLIPIGLHEFTDTGNYSLDSYLQNFLAVPFEKDGKLYDRGTDPDYLNWLKTFRQANEEGLLAKDVFVDKRPQVEEKAAQGRYFAMLHQNIDIAAQNQALYNANPDGNYVAIDGPANADLADPTLAGPGLTGWTLTLISKDVKDKAKAIQFLTYLMSEEGNKDMFLGEKGVTYDTINGKDQFLPEVKQLMDTDGGQSSREDGVNFKYWMLMDTNIRTQWEPPASGPNAQPTEWTKGKSVSFSLYDYLNPTGTSEEGIMATKISQLWGRALPKLVLAPTENEFDAILEDYKKDRMDAGYEKVEAFRQARFEENKVKLGVEQ
ncbi:MAG: transporter substrate-binding protein [Paenibacillus sp.]|nr:transporter substrate-binding protein [Paenibacillus sp.]